MAHDADSPPRSQRLVAIGALCALAAATAVAFGRVFTGDHAIARLVGVALASALLACALERRSLVVATLVSAAGLVVVVAVVVFPQTTLSGLPTLDTLHAVRDAAGEIGRQADAQVAPTPPLAPLFLAAVTALWAAIFSAHALAIRAGSPLLALLPPVALVAFADTVLEETERPLYGVLFLATALVVVFLDGLRRVQRWGPTWVWPGARGGLTSATGRGARRVAALALGVATLVPLTLPGFGTDSVIDLSGGGSGDSIRVNPLVSIRTSLNRGDPVDLFSVQADIASYWRTVSLDTFDGVTWKATEGSAPRDVNSTTTLSDPRLFGNDLAQTFTVSDRDLSVTGVPVAYPATHVDFPGDLRYDGDLEMLRVDDGTIDAGTSYTATSMPVQPPPAELNKQVFPDPSLNPRYTEIPGDLPIGIGAIATSWVEGSGAETDYERILAIQDHLRDPTEFTYDATVPARDDQFTLLDFLQTTKAGFCQQYASAMAVMLRTLGYPTRVAVGFTQGDRSEADGLWHVTTDNAHAWVEVLFPTYGWLAFEPTPGRTNPIANGYDNPAPVCRNDQGIPCSDPGGPGAGGGPGQSVGQRLKNDRRPAVKGGPGGTPLLGDRGAVIAPEPYRFPTGVVLGVLGALLLLVLLLVPPGRALRRRARLRRAGSAPRARILAVYEFFDARAAAMGWARRAGETLLEYRGRVARSAALSGDALAHLIRLAGLAAYGHGEPRDDDAAEAWDAADRTLADLRRGTPIRRRVLGWYLPERLVED
jgi:transglutaminase-like putative cysteine protease